MWCTSQGVARKLQMTAKTAKDTCGNHMTHLGVPETFTEQMRIIEGTQCERAEQRPVFRGFCHLCKGPCWQHLLYIKFPRMQEKSVFLRSSSKCWHLGMSGEKNVECVKSIFQRHFSLYLSCTKESTGYPVSEAPAQKIKNASCLHLYEVLYRNRPHPSAPPVLSKMVLE